MDKIKKNLNTSQRFDFSERTKQLVRDKAGNLCSYENCLSPVKSGDSNSGDVAHIFDATNSVAIRGQGSHTEDYIKSEENGILLCKFHHPISDSQSTPPSIEKMRNWKLVREFSHKLTIEDEDIRRCQPHIGSYYIDLIVRQELEKNITTDGLYDAEKIDVKNIRKACKLRRLSIEIAENISIHNIIPTPPTEFNLSNISEIYNPYSKINKTYDFTYPAENSNTNFSLICDLIKNWNTLPIFHSPSQKRYNSAIGRINVGLLTSRDALIEKFDEIIVVNAEIFFVFNPLITTESPIFRLRCDRSLIFCKFSAFNGKDGFYEKKEIQPDFQRECLPISLQWNFSDHKFEEIRKFDRLLQKLDSGDKLIIAFSNKNESFGDYWPHDDFTPHDLRIQLPEISKEVLEKLKKIIKRAMLVEQLWLSTLNWEKEAKERFLRWVYTDECFDSVFDDTELTYAMKLLENALPRLHSSFWETNLSIKETRNHQFVLRYKNGEVYVTKTLKR